MKIAILGCGLRTPLLLSGLARASHSSYEVWLYDLEAEQATLMANLGRAAEPGSGMRIDVAKTAEQAIADSDFVICSIRPGGMEARARDERICLDRGYAGQETIGPAGCAMAWRTIPAVLEYARIMEKRAPTAWLVNFTNPAGLVTQAVNQASGVKTVGICDTPAELFFRISLAFGVPLSALRCGYLGLNHLGFVYALEVDGKDRMKELLENDEQLRSLYPAPLFPPELIRRIGCIPTEYGYFYYRAANALANQKEVARTRGEELLTANQEFYPAVRQAAKTDGWAAALAVYVRYLNRRNASYLQLEGNATSALNVDDPDWDPFAAVTGYHRIAVDTIKALSGVAPASMVLNVPNQGALSTMDAKDVVEVNCRVDQTGVHREERVVIPAALIPVLTAAKEYERAAIEAALENDRTKLVWALTQNPLVGDWDKARELVAALLPAA